MEYHTTKTGEKIKITDLKKSHLENIIKWIKFKSKNGLIIISGRSGPYTEDIWADEEICFGKKVKKLLNLEVYEKELKRRENLDF